MKIKSKWVWIIVCSLTACDSNRKDSDKKPSKPPMENTQTGSDDFIYHFHILDSISYSSMNDTVYVGATPSIEFMEVNTGIEAHSDGTLFGKLVFSKEDLQKWHE
ncbi:hypothetical protein [Paraflavitalea speifideaquila]|uniref:hypothetical protein n=1 Tax=Paraflavitalea speifideaquila TaxID=3076558 RepID=UPI0028E58F44|nr:hypothetical protein [Paraflavitalea speifideiaquila]